MKRYSTIMSVLLTLALPVAATCAVAPNAAEKAPAPAADAKQEKPKGGHSMMMGGAAAETGKLDVSGKVVETMNGGGYSYANLEGKDGKKNWVAYPTLETRVGDNLSFRGCMEMAQFQSKTLNRSFETIYFCGSPEVKAKPAAAKAQEKGKPGKPIKVEKAEGPNAYTVAELFAKRAALNGKQVVVKGQVTRVSSGIMGKNWIHLQDGTGSEKQKTNDLVVTSTSAVPEVGDIITMSGTLVKDKNFGSGYKYDAIIEKGVIKK